MKLEKKREWHCESKEALVQERPHSILERGLPKEPLERELETEAKGENFQEKYKKEESEKGKFEVQKAVKE